MTKWSGYFAVLGLLGGVVIIADAPQSDALFVRKLKKGFRKFKSRVKRAARSVRSRVSKAAGRVRTFVRKTTTRVRTGIKTTYNKAKAGIKKLLVPVGSLGQTVSNALKGVAAQIRKHAIPTIVQSLRVLKWCKFKSFRRNVENKTTKPFTMLFASDPQLPWWGPVGGQKCSGKNNDECVIKNSRDANRDQVRAMNTIQSLGNWPASIGGSAISKPEGVVINGDLTAYAHTWQWYMFEQFYNTKIGKGDSVLRLPVYLGLGNHDYSNNLESCRGTVVPYLRFGTQACARFSVDYIKRMMSCKSVGNFDAGKIRSFDEKSLAYSWDVGDYHFVQLHLHPTYSVADKRVGVSSTIPWLTNDLADAERRGKRIVLNFHDAHERANLFRSPKPEFMNAIRGKNVVAIFAGHIHSRWGLAGNVAGTQIPVFLSGSSDNRKFLVAEFSKSRMRVAVVDSAGGKPKFVAPSGGNRTTEWKRDF